MAIYKQIVGSGGRPVFAVFAPCNRCGSEARGLVSNSRRGADVSESIARQWANQLRDGDAVLNCVSCERLIYKARTNRK